MTETSYYKGLSIYHRAQALDEMQSGSPGCCFWSFPPHAE